MIETRSIIGEISPIARRSAPVFDDTDDLELQQIVDKLEHEVAEMKLENSLFETTLERKKAETTFIQVPSTALTVNSSQATTPTSSRQDLANPSATSRSERATRKRSKSRSTQGDFRIHLTLEQKLAIAMSEYELTKTEKLRLEILNAKKTDQLESDVEWISVELMDIESAIKDLLKTKDASIDKSTRKIIGEKIDRYFHDYLQTRTSLTNKLRDRSSVVKRQIMRLEMELKQKEEMGETLHEVDFNQLKIENQQYLNKIDEKNIELVLLKRQVGKITQLLNNYRDNLQKSTQDLTVIQERIDKQEVVNEYAQQEIIAVSKEQLRASKSQSRLIDQIENYEVPSILDYVRKKALLYKLQRDCEVWKRKVDLVSMAFHQSKQAWHELNRTARYNNNTTF